MYIQGGRERTNKRQPPMKRKRACKMDYFSALSVYKLSMKRKRTSKMDDSLRSFFDIHIYVVYKMKKERKRKEEKKEIAYSMRNESAKRLLHFHI